MRNVCGPKKTGLDRLLILSEKCTKNKTLKVFDQIGTLKHAWKLIHNNALY